ncbi:hypothetical protein GCM10023205_68840 [Yinghuangia aomiensis]|uniref:TerD domain-containing protein n=1 Tax=Yinghuangia aomiensis TaxID=676205 RepID=A0ABP9I4P2_9ACTN
MDLLPGANAALPAASLAIDVTWRDGTGVDVSALLLGADGKVRGDADMVFFNNPESACGAVRFTGRPGAARIDIDPKALPADVERVALVAAVDVDAVPGTTFAQVAGLHAAAAAGVETFAFAVPDLDRGETAAVLAEVYRRGADWKIRAVGQGYASGLAGVATDFGVDVGEEPAAETPAPAAAAPVAEPAPTPPVSLGKIDLAKGAKATISFDKRDDSATVVATLEWDGGSESRREQGADLDLYALFVPAAAVVDVSDATIGVRLGGKHGGKLPRPLKKLAGEARDKPKRGAVYWNHLGYLTRDPHIALDKDAKKPGIETVRITRPQDQGFVLICAYSAVGNGIGSFKSYGAKAVVTDGRGSTVTAPLYDDNDTSYWVAIALVDFTADQGVAIHHVEAYSDRSSEQRPVLFPDGSFAMDQGPIEFK